MRELRYGDQMQDYTCNADNKVGQLSARRLTLEEILKNRKEAIKNTDRYAEVRIS